VKRQIELVILLWIVISVCLSLKESYAYVPVNSFLGSKCILKDIDATTGNTRYSFIITNLSTEALGAATEVTVPIYGGIGNKFTVELFGSISGTLCVNIDETPPLR